jgi:hypothetical protein
VARRTEKIEEPQEVNTAAANVEELLLLIARAYSLRAAFYQAVLELSISGDLVLLEPPNLWEPSLGYNTARERGGIDFRNFHFVQPLRFGRLPLPNDVTTDPDVFLMGIDRATLHLGIHEAIQQSLDCFRRGLYMPSTAMLAAGAEAAWTECGTEVARHLSNSKLDAIMTDPYASISKKVAETRKALEHGDAKTLLKAAGRMSANIDEAHVWTTVLRDRRNALHWGKAKSFVANHSETASLLMGAPLHLATLEAIRSAC